MSASVKNGLMMAATLIAIYFIAYFVSPTLNFNFMFATLLPIVAGIFFVRKAIISERTATEGVISFGEAFTTGFTAIAIGLTLFNLVNFIHLKLDPVYYDLLIQSAKDQAVAMFDFIAELFNIKGEDFDKGLEEIQNQDFNIGTGGFILSILGSLIWPGAVIAVIMAAVIKKH